MPITHDSKLFSTEDAKVGKLLTDPSGGSATYGALVDIPGIREVSLGFELNTVSLTGDNRELETDTVLRAVTLGWGQAKVSLDALAILIGGAVTDSGVAPNQIAQFRRLGADVLPYFRFAAKTPTSGIDVSTGAGRIEVFKCKITDYSIPFVEQDYAIISASARGVTRLSDDRIWDLVLSETATAIV